MSSKIECLVTNHWVIREIDRKLTYILHKAVSDLYNIPICLSSIILIASAR